MATEHLPKALMSDNLRVGTDVEAWTSAFQRNLFYFLGRFPATAAMNDKYVALAYSVRHRLLDRWVMNLWTRLKLAQRAVPATE